MATPKKEVRQVFDYARALGFETPKLTGGDHWRLRHPKTGNSVTVSATPSDRRSFLVTAKADLRRAAGKEAVAAMERKNTNKKGEKFRPPGSVQESILAALQAAEPNGETIPGLQKALGTSYPPSVAMKALESMGLVCADRSQFPYVWRPLSGVKAEKAGRTAPEVRAAQETPPPPREPEEVREEPSAPAPPPAPAPAPERKGEPEGTLLAEVLATMEVKLVRDLEGNHFLVLPFSFRGGK